MFVCEFMIIDTCGDYFKFEKEEGKAFLRIPHAINLS